MKIAGIADEEDPRSSQSGDARCAPAQRKFRAVWAAALSSLVFLACLYHAGAILSDPDTQWHIHVGRNFLATFVWPTTDTISYTFEGKPWFAKEWLSQAILAAAYINGGWSLVVLLIAAVISLTIYKVISHLGSHTSLFTALLTGWIVFFCFQPTILARPHVLAFPLVVLWTIALVRGAERLTPPWYALAIMALWANLHAGFTVGFVVAAAMGLETLIKSPREVRTAVLAQWTGFGLAALVAAMMTPYGAQSLLLNFRMAGAHEAVPLMIEFQPLELSGFGLLLPALSAIALVALALEPAKNAARLLLVAFLTYAMLRHARFTMYAALVTPIIAGPAIASMIRSVTRKLGIFQHELVRLPAFVGGATVAVAVTLGFGLLLLRAAVPPEHVAPYKALASVPQSLREENVYNSYEFGGFLAFHGVKTFIDGRSDQLFLGGFLTRIVEANRSANPDQMASILDQYRTRWAIVSQKRPEARLIEKLPEWQLHYVDEHARVFVRK